MKTELRTTHFSLIAPCTVYGVLDTLIEAGIASGQLERLYCLNHNAGKLRPTNRSSAYCGHLLDHQRKLEV